MELEFDKEMDAILRKARGGSGVPVISAHLDADTIAAFVENALPPRARMLNMEHFADCDRCRKHLSFAMSMNNESEATEAASVVAPIVEAAIPWYSKLFRTPNLALAMGALAVAFSGIIGYLVIQNRSANIRSDVAVANVSKPMQSGPASGLAANSAPDANKAAIADTVISPAAPAASPAAASTPTASQSTASEPVGVTPRIDEPTVATKSADADFSGGVPVTEKPESKSAATQPAPRPKGGQPADTRDEKLETAKSSTDDITTTDRGRALEDRLSREGPYSAKKKDSGPTRAGPSVTQQQSNANIYNQTQIRSVAGKSFDNRGGVWYDTAYNSQPMIRVTRGSSEYKKLDGSVKRAAENLGGTVVVVWKAKAYRIQ